MSDKKWFIYVTDHHEGPFTVSEIQTGISQGKFSKEGFVWADGMKDWLPMAQIPDFSAPPVPPIPSVPPVPTLPPVPQAAPGSNWSVAEIGEPTVETTRASAPIPATQEEPSVQTGTNTTIIEVKDIDDNSKGSGLLRPASFKVSSAMRPAVEGDTSPGSIVQKFKPLIFAVLVVFALVGLQRVGLLRGVEEKISGLVSTLPDLPDVSPDEYLEMKKAVKAPVSGGPQVALGLSRADPLSPIFYVSTNMTDGAKFELYVEGVPYSLLNTAQFSGRLDVTTKKHLGKSNPLRYPDGKPIPRGEYTVYVMEAPTGQPDQVYKELLSLAPIARNLPNHLPQERRLVYSKKIFFGSKDATYQQRLKEFHDGLVAKAKSEVTDLSQALATLDSQAGFSTSTYDRLRRQRIGPVQKEVWNKMNQTWRPIEAQLAQKYAGLSPDQVKENYFHSNLVQEFVATEKTLADLHSAQEKLFTTSATWTSLDPGISDLRKQFDEKKTRLKTAIDKAAGNPADPNGLPVRVEIEGVPAAAGAPAAGGKNG